MRIHKRFRGSVLVYTLFVLSIALVGALSLASVMLVQERSSLDTQDSIQSFQVANSAVERVVSAYGRGGLTSLNDLATATRGSCDDASGTKAIVSMSISNGDADITFLDASENPIASCSDDLSNVATVRSEGQYDNAIRVVETAFAAGGDYQVTCTAGDNHHLFCCRINTSDGTGACKYNANADGLNSPWEDLESGHNFWE